MPLSHITERFCRLQPAFCWVVYALLALNMAVVFASSAQATARIKDVVAVEGIRDNILVGYGLVVGLDGTGDRLTNATFTARSLKTFLARLGVNTNDEELKVRNVAAVTVTATMPPFSRAGSRIDVTVSTLGDARSLSGGTLVATPLLGPDSQLYAVAQGAVAIGGFEAGGDEGLGVSKGVPTSGFVVNGAIIEREVDFVLNDLVRLNLALRNPDLTTATHIARAVNKEMRAHVSDVMDPGTVVLRVPKQYRNRVANLLARIEVLEVETDQVARIIIDEASGTIVMNENVRIDQIAVAQGNLVVQVAGDDGGDGDGDLAVDEGGTARMALLKSGATLNEVVDGLNALGVGPRDMITILQTIKAAGALQAEIEAR